MNHIFKKIWNKSLGRMIVVSENAKSAGKTDNTTGTTENSLSNIQCDERGKNFVFSFKPLVLKSLVLSIAAITGVNVWANNTSGIDSTAVGYMNDASGDASSAVGHNNTASGGYSSAVGYNNNASGQLSSAVGFNNTALGNYGSAVGYSNNASGQFSSALGSYNRASGAASSAV
ncbi:MAG TPA: ESPR-type extended signal peptide-containing protein, partial [Acinetobacter sp.]|nr:ESPR-type extended signal peptide-containing protein [Acinetobacter sp.]